jgi:hypothetical protein
MGDMTSLGDADLFVDEAREWPLVEVTGSRSERSGMSAG